MKHWTQNGFILGIFSALIVMASALFVFQPTKVGAEASMQLRHQRDGIVIYGKTTLADGSPLQGVDLYVGGTRDHGSRIVTRVLDRATTDGGGNYKLWITSSQVHWLHDRGVVLVLTPPNSHTEYEQTIDLSSGDVAVVNITMRTPVVPIFPAPVVIY